MNSKQIECFMAVAKYLNFTKAGETLYASQSTVSRQIVLLEEELGFPLFYRGNNYVRLTPAGAIMTDSFSKMISFFEIQKQRALDSNEGKSGHLMIGFLSSMRLEAFCSTYLNSFTELYPNIAIDYFSFSERDCKEALTDQSVDILFTHDFDIPKSPQFLTEFVCSTETYVIYGKKHPLANKPNLMLKDFENEPFWTVEMSNTTERDALLRSFSEFYHIKELHSQSVSSFDIALLHIRQGNGVAFADDLLATFPESIYGKLPLDESVSHIGICVTWNKKNFNPAIALFTELILGNNITDHVANEQQGI